MKTTTLPTDPTALLARAAEMDHARRVTAVHEFVNYRLMPDGALVNMESGKQYRVVGKSGCTCEDYACRIGPAREAMTAAGVATNCCCKHVYARRMLSGRDVRIGGLVFRKSGK